MVEKAEKAAFEVTDNGELARFENELRLAIPEFARTLQLVDKALVDRVVRRARASFYRRVNDVSPGVPGVKTRRGRHGPAGISAAAGSIHASGGGLDATVLAGGAAAPTFFGFEFGGARTTSRGLSAKAKLKKGLFGVLKTHAPGPRTRQFPVFKKTGYVLYPILRDEIDKAMTEWEGLMDDVLAKDKKVTVK